ncbi:hypothetical protein J2Y69_003047 [Microbacterium resistens]|uniref:Nucleotidyltransferase n=1 Tax=Microbacterium resistens TaxID=156977 RepID=A0ABU1SFP0_9MICO|nr:hypothetical protein [Microbacterium resistens]MDR6868431.1 hypothetical protein [Microbacterium resistens]
MSAVTVEQPVTLWMVNETPARMIYAGRRWRVTDTPTRLRESIWAAPLQPHRGLYGWRFQGTDEAGESLVFDVYKSGDGWHVHHTYA